MPGFSWIPPLTNLAGVLDAVQYLQSDKSLIEMKDHSEAKAMKCKRRGMGGLFEGWIVHLDPYRILSDNRF